MFQGMGARIEPQGDLCSRAGLYLRVPADHFEALALSHRLQGALRNEALPGTAEQGRSRAERREPGIVQRPCLQAHAVELQEGLLPAQPRGHTRHFLRRDYRKRGVPVLLIAEVQGICVDSFPIVCGDVHPGGAAGHREVVCPDVQRQFIGVVACSRFSAAGGQQAQGHH